MCRVIRLGSIHNGDELGPRYRVMVEGEVYANVNRWLLAALEDGDTPQDLELEPEGADSDPWPGSPDEDSTTLARLRGQR